MTVNLRTGAVALAGLVAMLSFGNSAPAAAQREVENAADPYLHKGVGVAFPQKADGFERKRIVEFDDDGNNAAIGYTPADLAGEISIYLYPLGGLSCAEQFAGAHEAVMRRNAAVLGKDPIFSIPSFHDATQLSRSYTIPAGGYGYEHPELVSFLWVGCPAGGDWIVKYRASFLASDAVRLFGIEQRLFGALNWSSLLGQ